MAEAPNGIVLFHYPFSPYARRVTWYLQLRGIAYAQCIQPPVLPRPDLTALSVSYRRIPLMTIGKDVYLDTRLILQKLEERFPEGKLGSDSPDGKATEKLLESWMIEGPVFQRAAGLIPTNMPAMKDERFRKDREKFSGRPWSIEAIEKGRPENLTYIRHCFDILENTFLADGRDWILKTEKPGLADIEGSPTCKIHLSQKRRRKKKGKKVNRITAIWPFDWLIEMPGALPKSLISPTTHPKVFAWVTRFRADLKSSKTTAPKPVTLKGPDAVKIILASDFAEQNLSVDETDAQRLKKGAEVEIYPIDSGFSHKDRGFLVGLARNEVVVQGEKCRIHAPRTGFRVTEVGKEGSKL
ncbi:glutathione S-transferase [Delitschia confertaspora ATCC 74209]|uniref:Glutathione S-transferase n=1 Tax=Delitschia confertaspora ATCC 74209 TaxID=1513339 RepID=A0A9P4JDB3_9PLEO|nr:glutathione S-transferase [Delitschia confertaspora ATCC 74209]